MKTDPLIQRKKLARDPVHVQAFTLFEILVVVGIIAVVAAIAIPSFINSQPVRAAQLKGPDSLKTGVEGTYTYTLGTYRGGSVNNGVVEDNATLISAENGTKTVFTLSFDESKVTGEIVSVTYISSGSVTGDAGTDAGNAMVADPPSTSPGSVTSGNSKSGASGITTVVIRADGDGPVTLVGTSDVVSATKVITITP